jgi:acyl-CoA reductase-like NAD-dependent aldehyde dehydrogenase
VRRYAELIDCPGDWTLRGEVVPEVGGKRGHYVRPALRLGATPTDVERFVPIGDAETFSTFAEAVAKNNASPFGLSASVFTGSPELFHAYASELQAANIYANLPTTFSPSTLPFGGWGLSGNGRPGGRGFVRFCTVEQAIQVSGF